MARIPDEVIDEVIRRTDIVSTVQQYVTLKKAGANFKGLCPFHSENTPSFNVHPGKGIYKCFGCGEGGNVIGFLMEIEGWNFPETVRMLAERHGIEIPEESEEEREEAQKRRDAKKLYLRITETAREFFEYHLWEHRDGKAAQLYLKERGIDEETAKAFNVGYAPSGWQNLLDHMATKGVSPKWVERAGLALQRNSGDGHYDRFRHRIIFPVRDIWGNTLAFGGRVFAGDDDGPKYINSPETKFYTKGQQLYGLAVAKQAVQKAGHAILVEGNFDVIALHAKGVDVAVAPMGTAVTSEQAGLLARYCREAFIAFDGDSAGEEATLKCMSAFEDAGIEAKVVRFDATDDPDTFVRRNGAQALMTKVEDAKSIVAWALDRALEPAEGAPIEGKLQALTEVSEILQRVENRVAWEHYAQEVSRRLSIEPSLLKEYIKRPNAFKDDVRQAVTRAHEPLKLARSEFGVLAALMDNPEWLDGFLTEEFDKLLSSEELSAFLHVAAEHFRKHDRIEAPVLLQHIEHASFRNTVEDALVASDELYADENKARRFYEDCVRALKKGWADRTLEGIQKELEITDFASERDRYQELIEQKMKVERFKQSLDVARTQV